MILRRHTLTGDAAWTGLGLHSGIDVTVTVHPGEDGIHFRLGSERVRAIPENVTDTLRCTRLGPISTIEHLMGAFAAHEITDAEVELTAAEMPAVDGSAKGFFDGLAKAGLSPLGEKELPDLYSRVFFQEDAIKIAVAKGQGRWRYRFVNENRWPHDQEVELADFSAFGEQIAPARTFGFEDEVPQMIANGLARGLDGASALVIKEDGYRNEPLFEDEPARHKLLDLIGDIYLSGVPVRALDVVAERSGHRTHIEVARRLRVALGLSSA